LNVNNDYSIKKFKHIYWNFGFTKILEFDISYPARVRWWGFA